MRQDVITRLVRAMHEAGLDATVAISPENFAYITGFLSPTQPLMRWRHAMAVVTADGQTSLVSVDMEHSTLRAKAPPGAEIAVWREFQFDAMAVLADVLNNRRLGASRIGIETDYLPAEDFAALHQALPLAQFIPAQRLLSRLREIKMPAEIEILRRLSRIADRSITEAYSAVGAGAREVKNVGAPEAIADGRAPSGIADPAFAGLLDHGVEGRDNAFARFRRVLHQRRQEFHRIFLAGRLVSFAIHVRHEDDVAIGEQRTRGLGRDRIDPEPVGRHQQQRKFGLRALSS